MRTFLPAFLLLALAVALGRFSSAAAQAEEVRAASAWTVAAR